MILNTFELILLSVAIVLTFWINCLIAGFTLSVNKLQSKIIFILIYSFIHILMLGSGMWIGNRIGSTEVKSNVMMAIGILLIFGLKILFSSIKNNPQSRLFDYSDASVVSLSALGEGINTLGIGLAIGLLIEFIYMPWLYGGIVLLVGIISGVVIGSLLSNNALKLRTGPIGAIILVSAAIKLTLTLAGL